MTKSNIHLHIAKFISSQQMESLETQQRVIELGKALVKELDVEPGNDTLSRWLVHYIAELMVKLENAEEDQKSQLQQQCFETILTLWQHRFSFKNGHRPFQSFEPIFRTLEALDPEGQNTFYRFWQREESENLEFQDDVKQWADFVVGLDQAARIWIKFALDQAIQCALDEKTSAWLKKTAGLFPDQEIEIIVRLTSETSELPESEEMKKIESDKIKQLKDKLEKLDAFIKLSQSIKTELISEISTLEQSFT